MWKMLMTMTLLLTSVTASAHGNHETASSIHEINHLISTGLAYLLPITAIIGTCLLVIRQRIRKPE